MDGHMTAVSPTYSQDGHHIWRNKYSQIQLLSRIRRILKTAHQSKIFFQLVHVKEGKYTCSTIHTTTQLLSSVDQDNLEHNDSETHGAFALLLMGKEVGEPRQKGTLMSTSLELLVLMVRETALKTYF